MKELVLSSPSRWWNTDEVVVTETEGLEAIILELNVAQDDMGKIIGKQGRIAKAIRSVVKAATEKGGKPVFVETNNLIRRLRAAFFCKRSMLCCLTACLWASLSNLRGSRDR